MDDSMSGLPLSRLGHDIKGSPVDASLGVLEALGGDVISFAMGCPGDADMPFAALAELAGKLILEQGPSLFNYVPTEGNLSLRSFLAKRFGVGPDWVLITSGGMQGLDLTCKLVVDPDDPVIVETPTYSNGLATIHNYGGRLAPIPMDTDGILVAQVERALGDAAAGGRPVKLLYLVPTFQNPSGVTLSLKRRERLVELARAFGTVILEDDPYRDLAFSHRSVDDLVPPTLFSLADGEGIVHVGTFSKTIAPGLRVGWVVATPEIVRRMVDAKQSMDTCVNSLGQALVARFCSSGLLPETVRRLAGAYREKRDTMLSALTKEFTETGCQWTEPGGGMFVWMTLPPVVDAEDLLEVALAEGVAFIPGAAFDLVDPPRNGLRLCFTHPPLGHIGEGVARLAAAYGRLRVDQARSSGSRLGE